MINKGINKFLDLPQEVISDIPKITIVGFNEMLIENYKGILEYDEHIISINTSLGKLLINGSDLLLKQISQEDIMVEGIIEKIEIESNK